MGCVRAISVDLYTRIRFPQNSLMRPHISDFRRDLVQSTKSTSELLRTAKLISIELGTVDITEWINSELTGYKNREDIPEYRRISGGRLMVHNPYRGGWEPVGHVEKVFPIAQAVPELEKIKEQPQPSIFLSRKEHFEIRGEYGDDFTDWEQEVLISTPKIEGILNAVRDRLLDWVLDLEKRGIAGEDTSFDEKEGEAVQKNSSPISQNMKPVVFISHITEESEIAVLLKNLIGPHFLGLLDFFVSSDGQSIAMGQRWLDSVSANLKTCAIQLVICSPKSVTRQWVNFEAGAAWIRDIPVIPLCHSGMTPAKLPIPLSLLQGATLTEAATLNLIVPVLAKALGANTPKVNFTEFVNRVKEFESRYTFWDECNAALALVHQADNKIIPTLRQSMAITIDLSDKHIRTLESILPFLKSHELMEFRFIGRDTVSTRGKFFGYEVQKLGKLDATLSSPQFKSLG